MVTPVWHAYHVWVDGNWRVPAAEHAAALHGSEFRANRILVGLTGIADHRAEARAWFTAALAGIGPLEFTTAEAGFEQVTLRALYDRVRIIDGEAAILYAHTKGAASGGAAAWRHAMTAAAVADWRACVTLLDDYDMTGPYLMLSPWYKTPFFAGNFWWARASYLARLPEIPRDIRGTMPPGTPGDNKWDAEAWPGLGDPRACDLLPGQRPPS